MKICHVVPSLEERHGGPSRSVRDLCQALAAAGHEVELLATGPGAAETRTDGRLTLRIFHRARPEALCRSPGLRARLLEIDAEVVHHHALWLRTLHYASRAAARRGAPLVVSPRGMMTNWAWQHHRLRKAAAARLIHPGALAAAGGWHATSEEEAADIKARGFSQAVCVAPNGVSAPVPDEAEAAALRWREACPAAAERPVALFYSRFHRKKRVLELIDLWLERGPADWLLLVVGIPEEYTPETLDEYAQRAGGGERVAVFSGAGRPPPYAVASLFLLPSHSENFGMVVAEALAHGVPALVTDTTPWRGLPEAGGGWCVPWEEFGAALAAATGEAEARLRQRGANGRDWVLREYSWDRSVRLLESFYRSLADRG